MNSEVFTYKYNNGEIQKVQRITLDNFAQFKFFRPVYSKEAFYRLYQLYDNFVIKKYSHIFGKIIIFTLPKDDDILFEIKNNDEIIYDEYVYVSKMFKNGIHCEKGEITFANNKIAELFNSLKEKDCLYVCSGKRNSVSLMPVGHNFGFMSEYLPKAKLKVNSNFFIMDTFDCATVYDCVGTPIGLTLKNGVIETPPMFNREAFLVDLNGKIVIKPLSINDVRVVIDNKEYINGMNCVYYCRPKKTKVKKEGYFFIIINNKVVAVKKDECIIPAGGFVIHTNENLDLNNLTVKYRGLEDYLFGIQAGNSAIINGSKTEKFISSFYNIFKFWKPAYPPSLYPLNYKKDRAPRIVIGANEQGQPILLWFEGAGKFGYVAGKDSVGASLSEVANICQKQKLYNAVNLDGGGSAQILIDNKRKLLISDRNPEDFSEKERAVPIGLYVD